MNKPNIILVGAGGHARSCIDVIEQLGRFNIVGLTGVEEELQQESMGYRVIGTDSDLPELAKQYQYALVTVGQIESPTLRKRLYAQVVALGFEMPSIISPIAHVSRHAELGRGSIVMHGAIVNANASVGKNCIINSKALVEHDAVVGDHCHISTGAIVNGAANIGSGSFVGSGSVVKQNVKLGSLCLVGMCVAVKHDHPINSKILISSKS